jgi:anaerobic magnesium-protoporphyrin IX monomethyl ester cyclase
MDLDQLPPPDYDLEDNYILINRKNLLPLTEKNMRDFLGLTYWTMYSRGCPFSCAYCCNDAYKRIHKDLVKLRVKSPQCMVKELEDIQKKFPYIRYINFQDDTFFALSEKEIKAFAEHYQKHIQLPFLVPGLNPSVFTENKFDYLVKSGLLRTRMGIQSGSPRVVKEIYKRTQDNQKIIGISKSLQKYSKKMTMPNYDIIIDNPWETKEDILKTIDLLGLLTPPFSLNIFSLEFFPGTRLHDRALQENLFSEDGKYKPYYHYEYTYLNLIILIYAVFKIPKWLIKILLAKHFVQTNKEFKVLHSIFYKLMLYRRGLCALVKRDYSMFPAKLQFFFCRILPPPVVNKAKTV